MDKQDHVLHLFTKQFPLGAGEPYLYNEIPITEQGFSAVYIYPLDNRGKNNYASSKIDVQHVQIQDFSYSLLFFKILLKEFFLAKNKISFLKRIKVYAARLKKAFQYAKAIKPLLKTGTNATYYSFWMNGWALSLAILKEEACISNFCCRVNGFDIYSERKEQNYIPFQAFIIRKIDKVFTVSREAERYLIKKYHNEPENKFKTAYFGVHDPGFAQLNDQASLRIVTNSNIIPLKRVSLLAKALQQSKMKITWMHHGEGKKAEEEKLMKIVDQLPENIKFHHSKLTERYEDALERIKSFEPHVLVNLSTSEGLPVSIIEATAMGIPVIATNVGGTAEIINDSNGVLLSPDITAERLGEILTIFSNEKKWFSLETRKKIRNGWQEKFSALNNYKEFTDRLKEVGKNE